MAYSLIRVLSCHEISYVERIFVCITCTQPVGGGDGLSLGADYLIIFNFLNIGIICRFSCNLFN